jgi:hypothetical protein
MIELSRFGLIHQEKKGLAIKLNPYQNWWPERESNLRHADFQSAALPTELSGQRK